MSDLHYCKADIHLLLSVRLVIASATAKISLVYNTLERRCEVPKLRLPMECNQRKQTLLLYFSRKRLLFLRTGITLAYSGICRPPSLTWMLLSLCSGYRFRREYGALYDQVCYSFTLARKITRTASHSRGWFILTNVYLVLRPSILLGSLFRFDGECWIPNPDGSCSTHQNSLRTVWIFCSFVQHFPLHSLSGCNTWYSVSPSRAREVLRSNWSHSNSLS